MALVKSGTFGSSPSAYYEIHADLLGGSGNTRQVKVHLALKVNGSSSSHYGYPLNWLPKIHTSNGGWQHVKGSERWNGSEGLRWYSWTATVDVGTTSSTSIGVGFDLKRSDGGSTSWNTSQSGSFNVGSTNTAPWMNGAVTIRAWDANGAVLNGYYPENVSTLHLSWPAGSDNEQGSSGLKYGVNQIVNGGGATTILYPTTSTSCTAGIGAGGEGQRLRYYVDCRDNSDVLSGNRADSPEIVKNTLTPAGFTGHSNNIAFDSPSFTLYYSGARNTDGSACNFLIYSDTVTIHNGTASTSGTQKIDIWRGGATPSGPYIKFDDLKNKFAGSNYAGNIHVGLRTGNNYGTYKYAGGSVGVDLRVNPNPARGQEISTDASLSTIYKKVAFANNYYFLPDGSAHCRVHWNDGSGKLGEAVSYEIFVAYGSGSWQKVADKAATGDYNYINHTIPKQTVSQQFKYLIRCKTSYGYYSDVVTSAQTLHYYNAPAITVGQINRTETTAEIPVTVKTASSIPNISTVGTWSGQGSGSLTAAQTEQKINIKDLTGNGTYTITVVYNDNTGFSGNQTKAIAVGANLPIMFLNKYGLGVGGEKADANHSLKIKGKAKNEFGPLLGCNMNRIHQDDNTSPDDLINGYVFNYGVSSGVYGPLLSFGSLWGNEGYQLQLTGSYQDGNYFRVRTKNGDNGSWHGWKTLWHSGNFDTTNPSVNTITTTSNGQGNNVKLGDDCYIGDGNVANAFKVSGVQNGALGGIKFGDGGTICFNGGCGLELRGDGYISGRFEATSGLTVGTASLNDIQGDGTPWYGVGKVAGDRGWTKYSGYWGAELRSDSQRLSVPYDSVGFEFANNHGSVSIGPANPSHCHYQTDRPSHWFDREVRVQGNVLHGGNYDNNYTHGTYWKIQGFDNADSRYLHCATSSGAYGIDWWASDIRLKNNVAELTGKTDYTSKISKDKLELKRQSNSLSALDTIKKIEHFSFDMLDSDRHTSCGYIADQLQEVNKDFVMEVKQEPTVKKYDKETEKVIDEPNPMYFEEDPVIRNPKPSALIPYLTKAIQEQQEMIEKLVKRVEELEAK